MQKAPLLSTNPYLQDPVMRERLLKQSVISSCAIEGCGKAAAKALAQKEQKPKSS